MNLDFDLVPVYMLYILPRYILIHRYMIYMIYGWILLFLLSIDDDVPAYGLPTYLSIILYRIIQTNNHACNNNK